MNSYKLYKQQQRTKKELSEKSDIIFEDSHPYIAELVENYAKILDFRQKLQQISVGGFDSYYEKISNWENKNINMTAIKRYITPFV